MAYELQTSEGDGYWKAIKCSYDIALLVSLAPAGLWRLMDGEIEINPDGSEAE